MRTYKFSIFNLLLSLTGRGNVWLSRTISEQMGQAKENNLQDKLGRFASVHKNTLIDVGILCAPAIIIMLIWFWDGVEIGGLEPGLIAHDSSRWLYLSSYTWSDLYGTGVANSRIVIGFVSHAILTSLQNIGFTPAAREAIYFGALLAVDSLSMYYLTRMFVSGRQQRLAALIAGLLFMLNSYQMFAWNRMAWYFAGTPLLPLVLALFVKGMRGKDVIKPAIAISLVLLAFATGFVVFPLHLPIIILPFFILYVIFNRTKERLFHAIKFGLVVLSLVILTQIWWFLPVYTSQGFNLTTSSSDIEAATKLNTLPEVFRLFYDYHAFSMMGPFYSSGPLLAIGIMIGIVAFAAFLFKPTNNGVLFFGLLAGIGLFLSKGLNPPFEDLYQFMLDNLPYMQAIRTMFEKTGVIVVLGYAFLIGVALSSLYYRNIHGRIWFRLHRWTFSVRQALAASLVVLITFTIFGPYLWPMWTGQVLGFPWDKTYKVKVPEYYAEASAWLDKDSEDYRIVTLPLTKGDGGNFNWEYVYAGTWPQVSLFSKPVIATSTYSAYSKDAAAILEQIHYVAGTERIAKVLGMFNAKYVVILGDLDSRFELQYTGSVRDTPEEVEFRLNLLRVPSQSTPEDIRKTELLPGTTSSPSFVDHWSSGWGNNISFLSTGSKAASGYTPIRIQGTSDGNGNFGAGYRLDDQSSWSLNDKITIWIRSDVPAEIFINPYDLKGGSGYWSFSHDKNLQILSSETNKWKSIELSVSEMQDFHNVDFNSLDKMQVGLQGLTPNTAVNYEIGGIIHDRYISTEGNVEYPNFITNWEKVWGENHSMSISPEEPLTNSTVLSLSGNPATGDPTHLGQIGAKYKLPPTLISKGWQEESYLNFWLRTSHPGNLWIELNDIKGAHRTWDGHVFDRYRISEEDVGKWQYISLPADIGGSYDNNFDFENVAAFVLGLTNLDAAQYVTFEVSGLSVAPPVWNRVDDFELKERFGELSVYEINSRHVVDHINATPSYGISEDTITIFSDIASEKFDPKREAVLLQENLTPEQLLFLDEHVNKNGAAPDLTYEKIDPTKYVVHIKDARAPFFLGFVESYDTDWEAQVNGKVLDDKYHIRSYQNFWYITEQGDYDVVLEYTPQRMFYLGSTITILTLIGIASYFIFTYRHLLKKAIPIAK